MTSWKVDFASVFLLMLERNGVFSGSSIVNSLLSDSRFRLVPKAGV
jgi:hypothetical protein